MVDSCAVRPFNPRMSPHRRPGAASYAKVSVGLQIASTHIAFLTLTTGLALPEHLRRIILGVSASPKRLGNPHSECVVHKSRCVMQPLLSNPSGMSRTEISSLQTAAMLMGLRMRSRSLRCTSSLASVLYVLHLLTVSLSQHPSPSLLRFPQALLRMAQENARKRFGQTGSALKASGVLQTKNFSFSQWSWQGFRFLPPGSRNGPPEDSVHHPLILRICQ